MDAQSHSACRPGQRRQHSAGPSGRTDLAWLDPPYYRVLDGLGDDDVLLAFPSTLRSFPRSQGVEGSTARRLAKGPWVLCQSKKMNNPKATAQEPRATQGHLKNRGKPRENNDTSPIKRLLCRLGLHSRIVGYKTLRWVYSTHHIRCIWCPREWYIEHGAKY